MKWCAAERTNAKDEVSHLIHHDNKHTL